MTSCLTKLVAATAPTLCSLLTISAQAQRPSHEIFNVTYTLPDGTQQFGWAETVPSADAPRVLGQVAWTLDNGSPNPSTLKPTETGWAVFCENGAKTENDNLLIAVSGKGTFWLTYYYWDEDLNDGQGGYRAEDLSPAGPQAEVVLAQEEGPNGRVAFKTESPNDPDHEMVLRVGLAPVSDFGIFGVEARLVSEPTGGVQGIGYRVPLTQNYVALYGDQPQSLRLHVLYQYPGSGWGGYTLGWGSKEATEEAWHIH